MLRKLESQEFVLTNVLEKGRRLISNLSWRATDYSKEECLRALRMGRTGKPPPPPSSSWGSHTSPKAQIPFWVCEAEGRDKAGCHAPGVTSASSGWAPGLSERSPLPGAWKPLVSPSYCLSSGCSPTRPFKRSRVSPIACSLCYCCFLQCRRLEAPRSWAAALWLGPTQLRPQDAVCWLLALGFLRGLYFSGLNGVLLQGGGR